jgi:phosphoribosylanthranilate isomerase
MTWVKICGTTNLEDALLAVEAGADALGFVFYQKSPRRVEVETAREIVRKLPYGTDKVGVFVDQFPERICEIVAYAGLTAAQLHGQTPTVSALASAGKIKKAAAIEKLIFVVPAETLSEGRYEVSAEAKKDSFAFLLDSGTNATPGGTGKPFDWEKTRTAIQTLSFQVPVIVAGGLNPDNVAEAMRLFQPFGVDVASGVESAPGKKDPQKVREFVTAVRKAERRA